MDNGTYQMKEFIIQNNENEVIYFSKSRIYNFKCIKGRAINMRVLCGTDIIEIERIKKSIEHSGERFTNLVYTPAEKEYCESRRDRKSVV